MIDQCMYACQLVLDFQGKMGLIFFGWKGQAKPDSRVPMEIGVW